MEKAIKRYSPVFVLPTLLAFMIGFIIPFIQGLYLSFCQFTTVNNATFTGSVKLYRARCQIVHFLSSFKFTVLFAVASIVLINVIAFALALLLTQTVERNQCVPYYFLYAEPDRRNRAGLYLADSD